MDAVERLADAIYEADSVVALTGAGMSTASGIPDFRSDSGVWEQHDPGDFYFDRFRRDPGGFWEDRLSLHETMFGGRSIDPNQAHDALARLAGDGHLTAIVTQNTDGLHTAAAQAAGVDLELLELHGNASRVVCTECGAEEAAERVFERVRDGERPPRCSCGGILKPDVVLFGEGLDQGTLDRARQLARTAEVFLAIGSSLTVHPAASLPGIASDDGALLAIINFDETPYSRRAAVDLRADVTEILPNLHRTVIGSSAE